MVESSDNLSSDVFVKFRFETILHSLEAGLLGDLEHEAWWSMCLWDLLQQLHQDVPWLICVASTFHASAQNLVEYKSNFA